MRTVLTLGLLLAGFTLAEAAAGDNGNGVGGAAVDLDKGD